MTAQSEYGDMTAEGGGSYDPRVELPAVETSTDHFLATVTRLDDAAVRAPSLLPGWTRGHVLTHVARNADGLVNLLTWARTGVETAQYVSREARNADIERGGDRPVADQLADLQDSAERFVDAVERMPGDRWDALIRWTSGGTRPARAILTARLRELEIHHVDLDLDYTPAHWHVEFSGDVLSGATRAMTEAGDAPAARLHAVDTELTWTLGNVEDAAPVVSGPQAALLAWLIGRSSGDGLVVEPHETPLPVPPPWA